MPRFVILRHDPLPGSGRQTHWDLMFEAGDHLQTWALEREPGPGRTVPAQQLADHRPAYLDYEGPLSADRGTVARVEAGEFAWLLQTDQEQVAMLTGQRLRGNARLVRQSSEPYRWEVTFVDSPDGS